MRQATWTLGTMAILSAAVLSWNPSSAGAGSGVTNLAVGFPGECEIVLGLDLEQIKSAPLLKSLGVDRFWTQPLGDDQQDLKKAFQVLGFDPRTDLQRVVLGGWLSENEKFPLGGFVMAFQGKFAKFQPEQLMGMAKDMLAGAAALGAGDEVSINADSDKKDWSVEIKKKDKGGQGAAAAPDVQIARKGLFGQTVFVADVPVPEAPGGRMKLGLCKVDDQTVFLGDFNALKTTLAARQGKARTLKSGGELGRLTAKVPRDASFWLAMTPQTILERVKKIRPNEVKLPPNLPKVAGLLMSTRVDKDMRVDARAWASDKDSAKILADLVRGGVAMARLAATASEEPLAQKLVGTLQVETSDREVAVSAVIPAEVFEQAQAAKQIKTPAKH
jgi:hypothetical protein